MNTKASFDFKYLDAIDVSKIIENLKTFTLEEWNKVSIRQNRFSAHKHTFSLPIIWDIKSLRTNTKGKLNEYNYNKLEFNLIENELTKIYQKHYGKGKIFRVLLTKLKPLQQISTHRDRGKSLGIIKRIHIPLITNKDILFTVGGTTKNLKEGEIWEINNQNPHSVQNNSKEERVHLIIDYLPEYL